jgi:quinol monooxygenase YgiN
MLDVAYRMTIVPGAEDEIWDALCAAAAASREEPGVAWFEAYRDQADPRVVLVVERYADEAAYRAHRETPHYAAWKAASADRIASSERLVGSRSS